MSRPTQARAMTAADWINTHTEFRVMNVTADYPQDKMVGRWQLTRFGETDLLGQLTDVGLSELAFILSRHPSPGDVLAPFERRVAEWLESAESAEQLAEDHRAHGRLPAAAEVVFLGSITKAFADTLEQAITEARGLMEGKNED